MFAALFAIGGAAAEPLDRETVLDAVDDRVPQLAEASAKIAQAEGKLLEKRGGLDPVFESKLVQYGGKEPRSIAQTIAKAPFAFGGDLSVAYNFGQGTFPEYDGDRFEHHDCSMHLGKSSPFLPDALCVR
ncbi:MAG: hypothetical protein AAF602_05730 [Myxococcota bacterium]